MPVGAGALSRRSRADQPARVESPLAPLVVAAIVCRAGLRGTIREPNGFVTTTQEDIMQTADIIARDVAAFGAVLPTARWYASAAG